MGDNGPCSCISNKANDAGGLIEEATIKKGQEDGGSGEKMDESLREEFEDLRIAQQEEADAVKELQRLINTPFQQNITLPTTQSALANNQLSQTIDRQQPCSSV